MDLQLDNQTITREYVRLLVKMAPKINDVFEECYFMGKFYDCDFLFQQSIVEDGICFTFNVFESQKMFYEELCEYFLISIYITYKFDFID